MSGRKITQDWCAAFDNIGFGNASWLFDQSAAMISVRNPKLIEILTTQSSIPEPFAAWNDLGNGISQGKSRMTLRPFKHCQHTIQVTT